MTYTLLNGAQSNGLTLNLIIRKLTPKGLILFVTLYSLEICAIIRLCIKVAHVEPIIVSLYNKVIINFFLNG